MERWRVGFWDVVDQSFRWIGRRAARLATGARGSEEQNAAAHAVIGGALVWALFGGIVGFALAEFSHSTAIGSIILGVLLGTCAGIFFGSFVEAVDEQINNVLTSLKSK